jgi:DHA3 family macrolide efflux protein-like MFS transporter
MTNNNSNTGKLSSLQGMRAFYVLWGGQFVSIFATRMTNFAITLWVWDLTGTVTGLVLMGVIWFIPNVILSPFAGTLIDRWNRKLVLALSDTGAAISTMILLYLFSTGQAEIWHLYLTGAFSSIFNVFQYPAYAAVVPTMVPKDQYARANGLNSAVRSASGIAAPLLAGALLAVIDIPAIMIIDLVTFVLALFTLAVVFIPQPKVSKEAKKGKGSIWSETVFGFQYILKRQSLVAIFLLFTFSNIGMAFLYPMIDPMILAKTGDNSVILGLVRSAASAGFLVGGLLMSTWGGTKKRIYTILGSFVLQGIFGGIMFGRAWSTPYWIIGSFSLALFTPIINSAYIAILQAKIEPDIQGRIFGIESTITTISFPLGQLLAGYLADHIFTPALSPGGSLVGSLGAFLGVGSGAGIGAVMVIGGLIGIIKALIGYVVKPIREIETLLPDHEIIEEKAVQPA